MADQAPKWIVKDGEGRIYGPFATEKVLRQIEKGYFAGGEMIAKYPGGSWIPISKAPEFYDKLLDVLAGEAKLKPRPAFGAPEVATPPDLPSLEEQKPHGRVVREFDASESDAFEVSKGPGGAEAAQVDRVGKMDDKDVIELTDLQSLKREEKMKASKLPLFLILASFALVALAIIFRPEGEPRKLRLIAPRKGQPEISGQDAKERFRRGLVFFQHDTLPSYLRAQTEFVQLIEGSPQDVGGYAALCMTYRELWSYTTQDSEDMRIFAQVAQDAKRLDPAGFNGATCEIMYLISVSRFREVHGLTDMWIQMQSSSAILYDVTAELLKNDRKWLETAGYAEKARVLWGKWLKPYIVEARARNQLRQHQQAMQLYRAVLNANPKHHVARIELGLIEMESFNQVDKAYEMLKAALDAEEKLPRETEFSATFAMAQILERRNSRGQALGYAQRAYELDPNDPTVRNLIMRLGGKVVSDGGGGSNELLARGDELFRIGDYLGAQAVYRAAFEADAENGMAAMKAGRCFWLLNQSGDAIDWLKKAVLADPKLIPAYVLLADYYGQRFDYLSASKTLQRAQKIVPRSFEIWRGFALVELRRNNFKGAADFAKRSLGMYEADAETYVIMAKAQVGLGRHGEAQSYVQRAIELDQSNVEAQSLYASILVSIQGIEPALVYVDSLIDTYSQITDYRVTKGELLLKEERYGDAITALKEARSLDPRNKKALLLLGRALHAQGQNSDALQTYLEAAEMDPSDAVPIFMTGLIYSEDVRTLKDAVRQFQRVLKINPRHPRAHIQLGYAYLRQNMGQEALAEAELERAVNPELADAAVLAAEAHFTLKQYEKCANEYQKAVARKANDVSIYVKMARCYRLSGAMDSAVSLLNQAKARESGNPDIYKELGATFHMRGLAAEAIDAYQQYLALAPNAVDRIEIEAAIRKIQSGDLSIEQKGN